MYRIAGSFVALFVVSSWAAIPPEGARAVLPEAPASASSPNPQVSDLEAAERQVAELERQYGANHVEYGRALSRLGSVQLASGDSEAALRSYELAVDTIEQTEGPVSASLFEPLVGLGSAMADVQRPEEALAHLGRAITLSRQTEGLFNLEQVQALRVASELFSHLGKLVAAEQALQYVLRIHEATFGVADPRTTEARVALAHWYARSGDFLRSRAMYRDSIDIIEETRGPNDLSLISPLAGLADAFRREYAAQPEFAPAEKVDRPRTVRTARTRQELLTLTTDRYGNLLQLHPAGLKALKRAITIADSQENAPLEERLKVYLQTGDWLQTNRRSDDALPYYRKAWELSRDMAQDPVEDALFSHPVLLHMPLSELGARNRQRPDTEVVERYVTVGFWVSSAGIPRSEAVASAEAGDRMINDALSTIRQAVYRPRFVDGSPVETPEVHHRFRYRELR
jgi:tetratricopeptide (TPR) repeat protein